MRKQDVHSDSKGRVNLGSLYADQEAKKVVRKGIAEAKKGKIRKNVVNLDKYDE